MKIIEHRKAYAASPLPSIADAVLYYGAAMPTVDQPTDSLRYTLLHAKRIVICPRNLLFIHRTRVVALTAVVTTVFRFAQRVTHTGCRNLTASTDDTLSRVPRAASSTHVAKSHPRQLIRQTTPR